MATTVPGVFTWKSIFAVLLRPSLWFTAVGAFFAFARKDWWKRAPFLPIPDEAAIRWRVTTAYGQPNMTLAAEDLVSYLRWRKEA